MSLERIPTIEWGTWESYHASRFRSPTEVQRLEREMQNYLETNEVLGNIIGSMREISDDPDSVTEIAYTLLQLINAQSEADELNEAHKLSYDGRANDN